ncbi:Membrane-bound transcription factor site-1 protease-like [Oopsacas minuta]|uniref:Membrane-bound transcription factor site-1 protease-like n=1 Tax=Oopsacas minuta TaxID=111878 RepID=A0AAV7JHE6_9METZ|nr:Membrane-bound transcription factor site-1 protease-like [Oopsacas minuta]
MNRLSSNEIIQQGRLLLSNFTYWSLDDVEGPDDVFEDDYDSIASLNGVDMPTQNFRNNYSIWESDAATTSGRIITFGDSSCFDSTDFHPECMWLMKRMLDYTLGDNVTDLVASTQVQGVQPNFPLPTRSPESELHIFSKILDSNNPGVKHSAESCSQIIWNRPRPIASGLDDFQLPNRGLKEYVEDDDGKLTFGLVFSSKVDKDFKLPYLFPICMFIISLFLFYWTCFRNSLHRTKFKFTPIDSTTTLPIV